MAESVKSFFQKEYNNIKRAIDNLLKPKKEKSGSQLVLQPIQTKPKTNR